MDTITEVLLIIFSVICSCGLITCYGYKIYNDKNELKRKNKLSIFVKKSRQKFNSITPEEIMTQYRNNLIEMEETRKLENIQ